MSIGAYMPDVLARTMVTDQCWIWLGGRSTKGYGQIARAGKHLQVHRIAYESEFGDIPVGMAVDHQCHDLRVCAGGTCVHRLCVNPDHLALLTVAENSARQVSAAKTHCKRGHELAGANLRLSKEGRRSCVTCARDAMRRYKAEPNLDASLARRWARENGYEVAERGRIANSVLAAWRESRAALDAA